MRSLRTVAPLALGLAVLALAGCQRPADQPVPAPPPVERVTATSAPAAKPAPPAPRPPATRPPEPAPAPETVVGLWPVTTLQQARDIQDGADAGHRLRMGRRPAPGPAHPPRPRRHLGRDPGRLTPGRHEHNGTRSSTVPPASRRREVSMGYERVRWEPQPDLTG